MIALDASALLAFLLRERGHQKVREVLGESCMSTVNFSEVLASFGRAGQDVLLMTKTLLAMPVELVEFSTEQATIAVGLAQMTRAAGLSLGDRACLALARARRIPAMTADRAWSRLQLGIEIQTVR
jgi:PIN domain nuclease of toxin-antitoxin system